MGMQPDALFQTKDDQSEIDFFKNQFRENKITMSIDDLDKQNEIFNQIIQKQNTKKEQLMSDEEMARALNFEELIRKQRDEEDK